MAPPRRQVVRFDVTDIDVRGHVLQRLATELSSFRPSPAKFDTHIKNKCDIHGKGSHIKGSGPNYLKTSTILQVGSDVTNPQVKQFIDEIATQVVRKMRG